MNDSLFNNLEKNLQATGDPNMDQAAMRVEAVKEDLNAARMRPEKRAKMKAREYKRRQQ